MKYDILHINADHDHVRSKHQEAKMINDYHVHTDFSDDSDAAMGSMIESAISLGAERIAITDHYDPDYPDPAFPFIIDFEKYHEALITAGEKYKDKIKVIKGIEAGIMKTTIEKCRKAVHAFSYDFVIGSFHCFDGIDLCSADYEAIGQKNIMPRFYSNMYECLKEYKCYDVLGHFNVIDRYIPYEADYSESMGLIEDILRMIISDGKGIEINTSSFRYSMGARTTPSSEILRMYKNLGGEILTIGSDAHRPQDIADHFSYAEKMAADAGFGYLTVFENRAPKMIAF